MNKTIALEEGEVEYTLTLSSRARQMRLSVNHDGTLSVTAPRSVGESRIEHFIRAKSAWILKAIAHFRSLTGFTKIQSGRGDFARYKDAARALVMERLAYFNTLYGFSYRSISIRNQKTRWGSCSKGGRLNFNYKIALLPAHLADYVIVHELCHLGSFDHSEKFWTLVGRAVPNHREMRRELKKIWFVR